MLRKLINHFTLADYDAANELASKQIVRRFTRGNLYLTKKEISDLSVEGNRATARLQKKISNHRS